MVDPSGVSPAHHATWARLLTSFTKYSDEPLIRVKLSALRGVINE